METEAPAPEPVERTYSIDVFGGVLLMLLIGGATMFVAVKWLLYEEPDVEYECLNGAATTTCFKGETSNMMATIFFGALWVASVVNIVVKLRRRRSVLRGPAPSPPPQLPD